ncbi:MAG: ABC transporter ATP-binding protein [Actinobacteria bacterium]|nr:ABC transporter ATP-binding protein [Actinomycetota bacterium]MBU4219995.1 ABC transporter ATP-binding protein [Actinomycetota bacterium]MBU4358341.1 ABC transporter ATP-binding protein [Actinomycetota bacterium]MCG2818380.1 ABC transporter ATP-binding protein [Actinomycetes bacterium]
MSKLEDVIRAIGLRKKYGERTVLDIETVSVGPGEILACLGPSGAGKSVLLRILNLLEAPTAGRILFEGGEVQGLRGKEMVAVSRRMAMLFQDPLLFSTTVRNNVAYGLKVRKVPASEREGRVASALEMVRLSGFEEKHVSTLSGGEAQRVALARALVVEPELLLLDEPFASLDRLNRTALQGEVKRILKENGLCAIFVTHDQEEAGRIGDRIVILDQGRIVQEGAAGDVFHRPSSEFAALFVGMENLYKGVVTGSDNGLTRVEVQGKFLESTCEAGNGERVTAGLRPEDVTLVPPEQIEAPASSRNAFKGRVVGVELAGPTARVTALCPFPVVALITRRSLEDMGIAEGKMVGLRFKATAVHIIANKWGKVL